MNEIHCNTFVLNNCLAAVSATNKDSRILATDGFDCKLHVFDCCGNFCNCESTLRPYRKLRYDCKSDSFTALSCCNRPNVYCIDNNLNENGYITLSCGENDCNCAQTNPCGFETNGCNELTDVSLTRIGGELFIIGSFRKSAYLFDINGKRLTKLCQADKNEILSDFISFGEEKYAMSTLNNGVRTISVLENGITRSGILAKNLSLRMLFEENGVVYGLFGQKYIYNQIIPIYENGILTLPNSTESCFCRC